MRTSPSSTHPSVSGRLPKRTSALLAAAGLLLLLCAASAGAAPVWRLDSLSNSAVSPGGTTEFAVQATNVGDQPTDGSDVVFTATLPTGLTAVDAVVHVPTSSFSAITFPCTAGDGVSPVSGAGDVRCVNTESLPPWGSGNNFEYLTLTVVAASDVAEPLTTAFGVSGGGGGPSTTVDPTHVADAGGLSAFGLDAFDAQFLDAAGHVSTGAGAHPDSAKFSFDFNAITDPVQGPIWPAEPVKDLSLDMPPGLVGDPTVADRCTAQQLANSVGISPQPLCPATSQVGTTLVRMNTHGTENTRVLGPLAVYNMVPPPGAPAQFAFNALGSIVTLDARVRTGGDYGITVDAHNIPEGISLVGTTVTLWGVPASPAHDAERACPGSDAPYAGGPPCRSGAPLDAFLRNPTACTSAGQGLPWAASVDSWFHPGQFMTERWQSHRGPGYPFATVDWGLPQGPEGCGKVPFDPTFTGTPSTATLADTPAGFSFDIGLPQTRDPDLIGQSDLRRAVVTLPEGVRVSPSSADGLGACAPVQIRLHDASSPSCPAASKVGTVTISTPLLDEPLSGGVYLASPHDNPFGTLLSLYVTAEGSGVVVKLAGKVEADPATGRLTTTFDDNPQTPFSNLHLQFDGGPRAPLVLPAKCGTYATHGQLTGWSGKVVDTDSTFVVDGGCTARFSPGFSSGTANNRAGSHSSLKLRFTREDQDQELKGVTVSLPSGLTGRIASVDLCPEAAAASAGSCPAGSKIGDVTVGAGAGPNPFYITNGRAYLTGPYKGAPFGTAIVVPAVAGPFDLGNVVVRSALFIDKHTADVRIATDPLPTILQGIPLQVRDVRVEVNRPSFFLNPTSCARKTITGALESTAGTRAAVSDRFQAAECASLAFRPRMVLTVGGRGHTARNRPSPLTTTVTMPKGNANLRSVRVVLPTTINARLTVINDACTRAEFESDIAKCEHARAGTATAVTPLLRDPLKASVYFVKNGHPIPDLFVALRGQVDFDLIGRVSIPGGKHLGTTFSAAPDVPIRSFTLKLFGDSKNGSVGAARNLCSAKSRRTKVALDYIAQSGQTLHVAQRLRVRGCGRR